MNETKLCYAWYAREWRDEMHVNWNEYEPKFICMQMQTLCKYRQWGII